MEATETVILPSVVFSSLLTILQILPRYQKQQIYGRHILLILADLCPKPNAPCLFAFYKQPNKQGLLSFLFFKQSFSWSLLLEVAFLHYRNFF